MQWQLFAVGGVALVGCLACATTHPNQASTSSHAAVMEMDEIHISAGRGQEGYQFESYDAAELFSRATELLNQQRCPAAVELYDRVFTEFGSSRYASAAAYNAGLCLQALGDFEGSAQRYTRVRDGEPGSEDRRDATFQLAEVSIQLERWPQVLLLADELLALPDLGPPERLEAMARRSQGLLGSQRLDEAENYARGALTYFRAQPPGTIRDEFFAAACTYVVAETYRERQSALSFPADAEGQKQTLLRRAELIVRAQQEYLAAMGFQNVDNYHWAAASGYRLGAMYDDLWHAVTHAPVPASVPASARAAYHANLTDLIRPLVRNAMRYWEATQLSIERAGIKTSWSEKIEADLARVRSELLDEPAPKPAASAPRSAAPKAEADEPPADAAPTHPRRAPNSVPGSEAATPSDASPHAPQPPARAR